jgi:hypothetical protein
MWGCRDLVMISQSVDSETVMTSGILILQPVCWSRMFAGCIAGCICVVHYCLKATYRSGVARTLQQCYIFLILIRHSNNASCNAAFCRPRPEMESKPPSSVTQLLGLHLCQCMLTQTRVKKVGNAAGYPSRPSLK